MLGVPFLHLLNVDLNDDCVAGAPKGFFDSSVGAQFANRSESPKKAAPKQTAPTRASSGGGFFDSSVGSQFANRSESPKKAAPAPRHSSHTKACSGGGFFDSSVGAQFANRSESPKQAAPKQAPPTATASGKLLARCFTAKRQYCVHSDAWSSELTLDCLSLHLQGCLNAAPITMTPLSHAVAGLMRNTNVFTWGDQLDEMHMLLFTLCAVC